MKLVKQIGYKLIICISIIMSLCCFIANTPVEASKVNNSDFYYSGTVEGSYSISKSFLDKLFEILGEILDFLFGIMTMGVRIVFVGWTALFERILTWMLEDAIGENIEIKNTSSTQMVTTEEYITLDAIFFNRVPLLDINVFNLDMRDDVTSTGKPIENTSVTPTLHNAPMIIETENIIKGEKNFFKSSSSTGSTGTGGNKDNSLIVIIKKAIASWYYAFRTISLMIMLVLLVYIGLQLAIKSSATDKALYKKVLVDWLVGMVLVFSIHYIMIIIIGFNEMFIDQLSQMRTESQELKVYEFGLIERAEEPPEDYEVEMTLYEEIRTRAYDARMSVGTIGMIMYMVLVYYTWKFTFVYLKRYLTIAILIILAPVVAVSYAFNKVMTGKSKIFSGWLKEFTFSVMLQSIHALIYMIFLDTALYLSLSSIAGAVISFVIMNFMCKAEKIFRTIFKLNGKLTDDVSKGVSINDLKKAYSASIGLPIIKNAAKKVIPKAAKIAYKPLQSAGNFGFGKIMQLKANGIINRTDEDKENRKVNRETKNNLWKASNLEVLRKGRIATALKDGKIDLQGLRERVNSLSSRKGEYIEDDGEEVLIDDEYIKKEQKALAELEEISNNKEDILKTYKKETTLRATAGRYIKGKWKDIMDPYQYLKKDGNGKYKAVPTVNDKKHSFTKVNDSVSKRLFKHFKLTKEQNESVKQITQAWKHQLIGFTGIFLGLPLLVAEPALGAAFLYKGIENSKAIYGKSRNFKSVKIVPKGTYVLTGFEGKAPQTIAEGAQEQAKEQIIELEKQKAQRVKEAMKKVKSNVISLCKNKTKRKKYNGKIQKLGNYEVVYLSKMEEIAQNVLNITEKEAQKKEKKDIKTVDAFLDKMAEKYFKMEEDKQKEAFSKLYLTIAKEQDDTVDRMTSIELQKELGVIGKVKTEKQADGKIRLAKGSENEIIDAVILDIIRKAGIEDFSKVDITTNFIKQINSSLANVLKSQKILTKGQALEDVIANVDKKIEERMIALSKMGKKPIEEKIMDEAIMAVMIEKGIIDISKVEDKDVLTKYKEIRKTTLKEQTSDESTSVIEKMKTDNAVTEPTIDETQIDEIEITGNIAERKKKLEKKVISDSETVSMQREKVKRKKQAELDAIILANEETLDNEGESSPTMFEETIISSGQTDRVLEMLDVQTKMHKAKMEVASTKEMRKNKYKEMIFEVDGTLKNEVNKTFLPGKSDQKDGSREISKSSKNTTKLNVQKDGSSKIEDLLKNLKNN